MNIIKVAVRWTTLCGLCPADPQSRWWLTAVKHLVTDALCWYSIIPQFIYIHQHRHDFLLIAPAIYSTFLFVGQFVQYLALRRRRSSLLKYIDDLGQYCAELLITFGSLPVQQVEQMITKYFTIFFRLSCVSASGYCLAPALIIYQQYASGTITNTTFVAPFYDMYYFFDTSQSPRFEIFYACYCVSVAAIVLVYLAKNFLFFGVCLYMVALYDELNVQMRQIDGQPHAGRQRLAHIVHCIRMHRRIIGSVDVRFITDGTVIFNDVIMLEFACSLFTLATLVFAATCVCVGILISTVELTQVAVFFSNAVCLFGELFLFCLTGTLVLQQANKLNQTVYGLRWYNCSRTEKRLLLVLMMRNQRPQGFSAFGYFKCNLETFQFIVSKVFATFTCLQSVQKHPA